MFKIPDDFLVQRVKSLPKIKTWQEKELLLSDDELSPSERVKPLLPSDIFPINDREAEVFLLALRENSVTEVYNYIVTCKECHAMNDLTLTVSDVLNLDPEPTYITINGESYALPVSTISDIESLINTETLDEISIPEYKQIEDALEIHNEKILQYTKAKPCRKCGTDLWLNVHPVNDFSSSSLQGLYQDYVNISTFTSNSKADIDNMYPFEREIFNNLINERLKNKE